MTFGRGFVVAFELAPSGWLASFLKREPPKGSQLRVGWPHEANIDPESIYWAHSLSIACLVEVLNQSTKEVWLRSVSES